MLGWNLVCEEDCRRYIVAEGSRGCSTSDMSTIRGGLIATTHNFTSVDVEPLTPTYRCRNILKTPSRPTNDLRTWHVRQGADRWRGGMVACGSNRRRARLPSSRRCACMDVRRLRMSMVTDVQYLASWAPTAGGMRRSVGSGPGAAGSGYVVQRPEGRRTGPPRVSHPSRGGVIYGTPRPRVRARISQVSSALRRSF
ncbi:hypothetical protein CERSUDRAFT_126870 [Gelatoporia subvermispora B]|uniref:Uncharacterized protein n=1 Tax=Ceriporiopsis subvermispora (strain B) TaxID=914234 RepID=M2R1Q2_CERS8|nr:hypothetical protein CERSUDRAFT_126870 [Gelatoporia subvermispora B]